MSTRILIIGAGIVGHAAGKGFIKKGYDVTFVDKDPKVVQKLKEEGLDVHFPYQINSQSAEISMFCINTPSKSNGNINLNHLKSAIKNHAKWLKNNKNHEYHVVVIRSTVPPGTTGGLVLPLLEKYSGMIAGRDFGLCMQPEFLRSHSSENDFLNPRITVIGEFDKQSGDVLEKLYADRFEGQIFRVDLKTAEFMKYVHNCFNAAKISFSNEMWLIGEKLGIKDPNLALKLATISAEGYWNPEYGTVGGFPYAGHCLPKDSRAFLSFVRKARVDASLLSAAVKVNSQVEELVNKQIQGQKQKQKQQQAKPEKRINNSLRQVPLIN